MFDVSENGYLFKIMNYLDGEEVDLEERIKTLASGEYADTLNLFENTLDQGVFNSPDYIRLRGFLTKWYTAHKVLTKIQNDAPKLFFLPDDHMDELMRSFGFPYGEALSTFREKVNFFLSLVSLYSSKGSKGSIERMLNFFNLPSTYILEHELQYDESGELVFRPRLAVSLPYELRKTIALRDAKFESLTSGDPHWFLTKEEIDEKVKNNEITLPSRSNYFSFRTNFTYRSVEVVPLYFFGYINNLYHDWKDNGNLPPRNITVPLLEFPISILELYLSLLYILYYLFPEESNPTGDSIRAYNGDLTYEEYEEEFEKQFEIPPYSRDEVKQLREDWYEQFTVDLDNYIFKDRSTVRDALEEINPSLKAIIDNWNLAEMQDNVTAFAVKFAEWLRNNLDADLRELSVYLFGFRALQELQLNRILNFFKPYRAKLSLSDLEYVLERPLFECIRYDDEFETLFSIITEEELKLEEELSTSIEQTYTEDPYVLDDYVLQKFNLDPISEEDLTLNEELGEVNLTQIVVDPEWEYDIGYNYDARLVDDNTYLTINTETYFADAFYPYYPSETLTTSDGEILITSDGEELNTKPGISGVINGEYKEGLTFEETVQSDYTKILDENLNEKEIATQSVGHYMYFDQIGATFDDHEYESYSEFVTIYMEEVA